MTRYTGTEDDFRRLAPKGLVLAQKLRNSVHCIIYYLNGSYRFFDTSDFIDVDSFSDLQPYLYEDQEMEGAWRLFRPSNSMDLYILQHPKTAIYRRTK